MAVWSEEAGLGCRVALAERNRAGWSALAWFGTEYGERERWAVGGWLAGWQRCRVAGVVGRGGWRGVAGGVAALAGGSAAGWLGGVAGGVAALAGGSAAGWLGGVAGGVWLAGWQRWRVAALPGGWAGWLAGWQRWRVAALPGGWAVWLGGVAALAGGSAAGWAGRFGVCGVDGCVAERGVAAGSSGGSAGGWQRCRGRAAVGGWLFLKSLFSSQIW
ncbi:glycine-rich cell wall structural protein-like [Salvia miltiorrhiza]|uniref:glycine-rich cell wall structural protein-like n=1 Tax=Salvia miltiorrhiza TaxID=226208 RepID=UPI0025ABE05E|nr:glycine-rich cell wall structural protein-like [Salvia miltiorrhiza]